MAARRISSLLIVVGCTLPLPLPGSGCNDRASSSDAADAPVGPTSTGGAASGGTLGMGGGSPGSGGTVIGGASGSGGTAGAGGTSGSGGTSNPGGSGGTASSGGATGLDGGRDGGNADYPGTVSTGGVGGLDAVPDGGTELRCVGTPSNLYCPASESGCYRVLGCRTQVPTTGHCNGNAHPCVDNTTPTSCAAQSGCVWPVDGGSSSVCGGTATYCTYDMSRDKCEAAGCQYLINGQYCTGTPTPCTQLSAADCLSQPGCTLG